jgi:hypothetical protein
MSRSSGVLILGIVLLGEIAYLMGSHAYALAAAPDVTPTPAPTPRVVVISAEPIEATPTITPSPRSATPTPSPTPHWAPDANYDNDDFTHLARYRHASVPRRATLITQIVACEVVQNRTINRGFPSRVRSVLQSGDFGGYTSKAKYYKEDMFIADVVMRSWVLAQTGDYSFRYTPRTGIYLSYSADGRYCKVYDAQWRVVCDTSQFD